MPVSRASWVGSAQWATTTIEAKIATASIAPLDLTAGNSCWADGSTFGRAHAAVPMPARAQARTRGSSSRRPTSPSSSAITTSAEIPRTNSARRASAPVQAGTISARMKNAPSPSGRDDRAQLSDAE